MSGITDLNPKRAGGSGGTGEAGGTDADEWFGSDRPLASDSDRLQDQYVRNERPLSWSDAVDRFRADHGPEDRFGFRWASGLWARWLERDRILIERTQTTLMLTLTASPWLSDDHLLPPVNHLDAVLTGRDAVLDTLADCLDCEHRAGWALGAQRSGYVDCHIGVWCFGRTDRVTVEPALRAYVDAVDMADPSEHGAGAVTAEHGDSMLADRTATDGRPPATRLGTYLVDNVPGSGSTPDAGMGVEREAGAGDFHRLKTATVLHASKTDVYRRPGLPTPRI